MAEVRERHETTSERSSVEVFMGTTASAEPLQRTGAEETKVRLRQPKASSRGFFRCWGLEHG